MRLYTGSFIQNNNTSSRSLMLFLVHLDNILSLIFLSGKAWDFLTS